jgi:hypothetical protein
MMAIEAMSVKKPVIVLQGTSLPDVTQAPNIGVACERNAQSLQKAIQDLIDNPAKRDARAELGYQYALKEYGLDIYLERMVKVYKAAIKNHKPSLYRDYVVNQLIKKKPLSVDKKASELRPEKVSELILSTDKIMRCHLLGFIPLASVIISKNCFRIKVFKSFTLFKKKIAKNKIQYYLFGMLLFKTKSYTATF